MSRPQKIHKPLKASFNNILAAVALGTGNAKRAAKNMANEAVKASQPKPEKKP